MPHEPVLIAGAGPIGLACAISAKRRGLDPLVIDAGPIVASIVQYPVGMTFFTTPERLEIGNHPITCAGAKPTREEAMMYYRGIARTEGIRISTYMRLAAAHRPSADEPISCTLASTTRPGHEIGLTADRLVLATGYFDRTNRLGVPGEGLPHVTHYADEAHLSYGRDVVVVGGKNSAVEMALALWRAGARVTLVYRGATFRPSVKYWLRPDIENRIGNGEIAARLGATVTSISPTYVMIRTAEGTPEQLPADRVYALIGFLPDFELFERIGIALDPVSGRPTLDPATLETNVPGVHMAGSIVAGRAISEVFIENGRWDGEKIFGDPEARRRAAARYEETPRPLGE
jgi:thioredoxin reductase (NADPH)